MVIQIDWKTEAQYFFITQKGLERELFVNRKDYARFLKIVAEFKHQCELKLLAFCVMPDAFYLIVKSSEMGMIPVFMRNICQAYTLYSQRQTVKGRFWQRRYKSRRIRGREQLAEFVHYIEMLPVKLDITLSPAFYPWSSCSFRMLGKGNGLLD